MCVFLISPVPITEPLTSELIDTPVFYNLAPRPIKYRVSVPIPNNNTALLLLDMVLSDYRHKTVLHLEVISQYQFYLLEISSKLCCVVVETTIICKFLFAYSCNFLST